MRKMVTFCFHESTPVEPIVSCRGGLRHCRLAVRRRAPLRKKDTPRFGELPDGRLKLIDGHLRRDMDPDMEVDVEVLDVTDEEARKLLLIIDPITSLTEQQEQFRQRLLEITPIKSADLQAGLQDSLDALLRTPHKEAPAGFQIKEQFLILVTCRDEKEQVELLRRFTEEGWECKALVA
jgi:hypothetical protein